MDRRERARLVVDVLQGLALLRESSTLSTAAEAHEIAAHLVNALAIGEDDRFGFEPERIIRTRRLLLAARPDSEFPAQVRSISIFLRSAARVLPHGKERAIAMARHMLGSVDKRLANARRPILLGAIEKVASRGSMSGAIANLLILTCALDTSPAQARDPLQKRIDRRLRFHSKPFLWEGSKEHRYFTVKRDRRR